MSAESSVRTTICVYLFGVCSSLLISETAKLNLEANSCQLLTGDGMFLCHMLCQTMYFDVDIYSEISVSSGPRIMSV